MILDTRLANDIAGLVQDISLLLLFTEFVLALELLARDGARISQHVAREGAVRVVSFGAFGDRYSGESGSMLLDIRNGRTSNIRGYRVRALSTLGVVLDLSKHRHIGHTQDIR